MRNGSDVPLTAPLGYTALNICKGAFSGLPFTRAHISLPLSEPAIDLTAASLLAFSWQMAGAPSGTP
jgi:hypothetical protein